MEPAGFRRMQIYEIIDTEGEFNAPVLGTQAGPALPVAVPGAPAGHASAAVAIALTPVAAQGIERGFEDVPEDDSEADEDMSEEDSDGDLEEVVEEVLEGHAPVIDVMVGQERLVINATLASTMLDQLANAEIPVVDLLQENLSTTGTITSKHPESSEVEFLDGHSDNILQARISTHPGSDTIHVATVGPFQVAPSLPPRLVNSVLEVVQPPPPTAAKADERELNSPFKSD